MLAVGSSSWLGPTGPHLSFRTTPLAAPPATTTFHDSASEKESANNAIVRQFSGKRSRKLRLHDNAIDVPLMSQHARCCPVSMQARRVVDVYRRSYLTFQKTRLYNMEGGHERWHLPGGWWKFGEGALQRSNKALQHKKADLVVKGTRVEGAIRRSKRHFNSGRRT